MNAYRNIKQMVRTASQDSKIDEVMRRSGCEVWEARRYLEAEEWSVSDALESLADTRGGLRTS
jgi:hypothetical protein